MRTLLPVLLAAVVVALGSQFVVHRAAPVSYVPAGESEDDSQGGDPSETGQIDCSIPDNQDDTGCDKGDVNDNGAPAAPAPVPATTAPAPTATPPPQPAAAVPDTDTGPRPRGGVGTGGGGTARR
jgi:hypothetical protein